MFALPLLVVGVLASQCVRATENEYGDVLMGDIMLTREQADSLILRKGVFKQNLWKGNLVPYYIKTGGDHATDPAAVPTIRAAIKHWMDNTCLTFVEHTTPPTTGSYLKFVKKTGCWSFIGQLTRNGQEVSIGKGCNHLSTAVHEIGHAMGFNHEQTRSDRDNYVVVHEENIEDGKEGNFESRTTDNRGVPYDYYSVMHYGTRYFSKNKKDTLVPHDMLAYHLMGQRRVGLTIYDKTLANKMYNCDGADSPCLNKPCLNGGVCSASGSGYQCQCPTGYEGTHCEKPSCVDKRRECKAWDRHYQYCSRTDWLLGFMKKNCRKTCGFCDLNVCEEHKNICLNGGTCSVRRDSFECTCVNGFEGPVCASRPKRCDGKVCSNAGYLNKSCNCECAPGTTGDLCETRTQNYLEARSDQVIPYQVSHGDTFNRRNFDFKNWRNYFMMKIHIKPESGSGEGKCAKATFKNHVNENCDTGFVSVEISGSRARFCGSQNPLTDGSIQSLNSELKIIYVVSKYETPFTIKTSIIDC